MRTAQTLLIRTIGMPTAWTRAGGLLCGLLIAVAAVDALQVRSGATAPTPCTHSDADELPQMPALPAVCSPADRPSCIDRAAAGELPAVFPAASASWHTVRAQQPIRSGPNSGNA